MSEIKNIPNNLMPQATASPNVKKNDRDEKMMEAAKSFENQFIRQMITEMRKTVPKDEVVPETMADDIFKNQLDDKYAEQWTEKGGIGLADIIYQQLQEKYAKPTEFRKPSGEFLQLPATPLKVVGQNRASQKASNTDIFEKADKNLFMVKADGSRLSIKSREPLAEHVNLRSPMSGVVLQAAALEDGREMVVIKHDEGLVSQFVHTGHNHVKNNVRVVAGEVIADLPPSQKGEGANVVFELRKAANLE
jgi:Rod binding domain-containing protein